MIKDLENLDESIPSEFDVCIVGAGPAGISIALELIEAGLTVCLAEGGGERFEAATQALYEGESVGHPMVLTEGRFRMLGGAATEWGGRCTTLDAIDFERRDWINASGWPITLEDLLPYYERAKRLSNFQHPWRGPEEAEAQLGIKLPKLRSADIETIVWRMAPPDLAPSLATYVPRGVYPAFGWGKAYRSRLQGQRDSLLLLHANCIGLLTSDDGSRVEAIKVRSLNGRQRILRARAFVLCAGGIENARLLLDAPANLQARVNPYGALGRYFMQHPRGVIATVDADRATARRLQKTYNHFWSPRWRSQRFATGFALSEQAQRRHELLNASAFAFYKPDASWDAARRLAQAVKTRRLDGTAVRDVGWLAAAAPTLVPNALRVLVTAGTVMHARPEIEILMDCEQVPDPHSRITLIDQLDALGTRRARVDWRFSHLERRTGLFLAEAIGAELERLGLGKVTPAPWLTDEAADEPEMVGTYHFMGATRMSKDPRTGVVDANCLAYGVENLYLAGASVFPTAGHANPTLSIVALALRIADRIKVIKRQPGTMSGPASAPRLAASRIDRRDKILVTGAAGFIGGWVCDALCRASVGEVRAGSRRIGASETLSALPVEQTFCDVFDRDSLADALRDVSVVINCARSEARPGDAADAVKNILEVGTPLGLERLVQLSSVAVYGNAAGIIDEDTPPVEPIYAYGMDKRNAESFCEHWAEARGVTIADLRPSLVYGPGGDQWTGRFIEGIVSGRLKRLGDSGEGNANLVYVRDLAEFIAVLVKADLPSFSVFNVSGDDAPTFNAYFNALSEAIGNGPLPLTTASPFARKARRQARRVARVLVAKAGRFLPLKPLERTLRHGLGDEPSGTFAQSVTYRTDRARAFGFRPITSLAEGVAASADWARETGMVPRRT